MTNEEAIAAINGQISILSSQRDAIQQNIDALTAAATVLQSGYQTDQQAITDGIAAGIATAKAAVDAALSQS